MFCMALGSSGGASDGTASVVPGVVPGAIAAPMAAVRIAVGGEQLAETRRLDFLQSPLLLRRDARLRQRPGRRNGLALVLRIEDRPAEIARQRRSESSGRRCSRAAARSSPSAVVRFSVEYSSLPA